MSESLENSGKKRKKGVRNDQSYQRNLIKKAKVSGEAHTNWRGRYVPSKNDPDFIDMNCCYKECIKMIANKSGKSSIDDILVSFYKMTSKNEQDIHLQRLMEIKGIERKRGRSSTLPTERKPKEKNLDYFILVNRQRIKVCKKAFLNVHKVTTKRIRRIAMDDLKKLKDYIPDEAMEFWGAIYDWSVE